MSSEVTTPIAGGDKSPVEQSNMSVEQFAARRLSRFSKEPAPEKAKEPEKAASEPAPTEPEKKPDPQTKQDADKAETKEPEAKEVHSQDVDLEKMSEAELKELAENLGSRAVARFGELTAKRKAAEERLQAVEAQLAQLSQARDQKDPLSDGKPKENPYKAIKTLPELQAKAREVDEVIEWADDVLWNSDHLGAEDVVATVDGRELTKAQVRKALKDAQRARKDHLPAQLAELQASEQRKAVKAQLEQNVRKELQWLDGEDNDVRKQYEALKASPVLAKAKEAVPEIEPYLDYMVAHAANSIYGRKPIELAPAPSKPSLTPPSNPQSTAASHEAPEAREDKRESDIRKRLNSTNAISDFVALRTAQISKRKQVK